MKMNSTPTSAKKLQKDSRKKLRRTRELIFLNASQNEDLLNTPRELRSTLKKKNKNFLPKIDDIVDDNKTSDSSAPKPKKLPRKASEKSEEDEIVDKYFDFTNPEDSKTEESHKNEPNLTFNSTDVSEENVSGISKRRIVRAKRHFKVQDTGAVARISPLRAVQTSENPEVSDCQNAEKQEKILAGSPEKIQEKCQRTEADSKETSSQSAENQEQNILFLLSTGCPKNDSINSEATPQVTQNDEPMKARRTREFKRDSTFILDKPVSANDAVKTDSNKRGKTDISSVTPCTNTFDSNKSVLQNPKIKERKTHQLDSTVNNVDLPQTALEEVQQTGIEVQGKLTPSASPQRRDSLTSCDKLLILRKTIFPSTENPKVEICPESGMENDLLESSSDETGAKNSSGNRKRRTYELKDSVTDISTLKSESQKELRESLVAESVDRGTSGSRKRRTYELKDSVIDIPTLKSESQAKLPKSSAVESSDSTSDDTKLKSCDLDNSRTEILRLKSDTQKDLRKSLLTESVVKNTSGSRKRRTYELDDSVTDVEILKSESQKDLRKSSAIESFDRSISEDRKHEEKSGIQISSSKSDTQKDLRKSLLIESVVKNTSGNRKRRTYELDDSVTDAEILKSDSQKDLRKSLLTESVVKNTSGSRKRRTYELDDSVTDVEILKPESQKDKSSAIECFDRSTFESKKHEPCDLEKSGTEIPSSKPDTQKDLRKSLLTEFAVKHTSGNRKRRTYELDDSVTDVEILKYESQKDLRKSSAIESSDRSTSDDRQHEEKSGTQILSSKSDTQKDLRKSLLIESVVKNTSGNRKRRTYELDDSVTDVEILKSESQKDLRKSLRTESAAKNTSGSRKRRTYELDDSVTDVEILKSKSEKNLRKSLVAESADQSRTQREKRRSYELEDNLNDIALLKSESQKNSPKSSTLEPANENTSEKSRKDLRKPSISETVAENKSDGRKRRTRSLKHSASEIPLVKSESLKNLDKSLVESGEQNVAGDSEKPQTTSEVEDSVVEVKSDEAQNDLRRSLAAEFADTSDNLSSDEEPMNQVDLSRNTQMKSEISEDLPESASETLNDDVTIHNLTQSSTESISPIVPETGDSPTKNSDNFSKVTTRRRNLHRKMSKSFGGLFDFKQANFRLDNISAVSLVDEDLDLNTNKDLDNSDDAYLMEAKRKMLKLYNLNESNLKAKPVRSVLKSQQRLSKTPQPQISTKKVDIDRKSSSLRKMTSTGKKSKVKVPNFALIHQKAFEKMENIAEYRQRKEERAKFLLSGKKPVSEIKPQSEMSATKPERKIKKQLRFAPSFSQQQEKSPFVPLPSTPLPRKSVLRRFMDENINLNDSSLIGSPIYVDSPSTSHESKLVTPLQESKIESQDNVIKKRPQNVSFGLTPPTKSKTNLSSQRVVRLTPAAHQPKIKQQWGRTSAGIIRIQTPAKSQLQNLPNKLKPNMPGRPTPMKSNSTHKFSAQIEPRSQGLPTPTKLTFSGLPAAAPTKSNLPRLPTPVKSKSHNISAQTNSKPPGCPTPLRAKFSGFNPAPDKPKLPGLPTPLKSKSHEVAAQTKSKPHGLPTPTKFTFSGLSGPVKSLNINVVQKFGSSPVGSKKPQLLQKNVGVPPQPSNHQASNKVSQQPQTGFNRFGFKMPNKNEPKRQSNRMEEMKKIVSKKKVNVKTDVAERRDCLKGVRSNRRFELLMKMRNQN